MEYRRLGDSGLEVSALGLGTNQFGTRLDLAGVRESLGRAFDGGINFIDTANIYGGGRSEELIGRALEGHARDQVVLATKVGMTRQEGPNRGRSSRYHIMHEVEASLRRLRTDHIDLYQLHQDDQETPIEETLRALDDLVASGKVRYLGVSNFPTWRLAEANALARARGWAPIVSSQPEYSLLARTIEAEHLPYCRTHGVGVIPYRPLMVGLLTGKYRRGRPPPKGARGETDRLVQRLLTEQTFDVLEGLESFCTQSGRELSELAIAWLLAQPGVATVIAGVSRPEQVEANLRAAGWKLTAEEEAEVRQVVEGRAQQEPEPA